MSAWETEDGKKAQAVLEEAKLLDDIDRVGHAWYCLSGKRPEIQAWVRDALSAESRVRHCILNEAARAYLIANDIEHA